MNTIKFQLQQLTNLFKKTKIDYALLGGLAVAFYGEPRMSFDIDINILLDQDEVAGFLKQAKEFGFTPLPPYIMKFVKSTGVIPRRLSKNGIIGRADFIIAQNDLEYSGIRRAVRKNIYGQKAKIVSCEDLVLHKIISERIRDLEDLWGILTRQHGKLDLQYIELWLKKIDKASGNPKLLKLFRGMRNSLC